MVALTFIVVCEILLYVLEYEVHSEERFPKKDDININAKWECNGSYKQNRKESSSKFQRVYFIDHAEYAIW